MGIPQLRVRTEHSFRSAYGPLAIVAERLKAIGAPAAGIVDGGTWGHVKWSAALSKHAIRSLFGAEFSLPSGDMRPTAWALASDTKAFYRLMTEIRRDESDAYRIKTALAAASGGAVRFAGAALDDPATFDYVDVNPGSPLLQRRALALSKKTKRPLVLTSDNTYPDLIHRDRFMAIVGRSKLTPQHILSDDEMRAAFGFLDDKAYKKAVKNTRDAFERCATTLPTAPMISFEGDLHALAWSGKERRLLEGRIGEWTPEYDARLRRELDVIDAKGFHSYFLVVSDLIAWAKERMLVGPGRGSSAGSLLCFLIGITEVDPIPHGLLFERFIDLTRKDLPDIDIDFNDKKRELIFEYLELKYGKSCVARLGNVSTLQPRSVIAEVAKRLGIAPAATYTLADSVTTHSSGSSLYGKGVHQALYESDAGKRFLAAYPEAAVMGDVEGHAWHTSVHAAGVIVSNVPVSDYATVMPDGVAQITKPDAEALNLLKIDALGLRTLGVLESANVVTNDQLYRLKLDDQAVFDVINKKRYCGVFQFEGSAMRSVAGSVEITEFKEIDHITALARPGPLGGGAANKYIERHAGRAEIETTHPRMTTMLEETFGVVLYQEQVMRIVREIGKFSWEETTTIRKAMSGRKGKEYFDKLQDRFVEGAAQDGIAKAQADSIWYEICNFGAWGMNKSHTCAYAYISYWCAHVKKHFPLEFAAACLRGEDEEGTLGMLRELAAEGIPYKAFDRERSLQDWAVINGELIGGFKNLVGFGPAKSAVAVAQRAAGWTKKLAAAIDSAAVLYTDLAPLRTKYRAIFDDPERNAGCQSGSKILTAAQFPEKGGDVLFICSVTSKKPRDYNEAVLIAKRISQGKRSHYTGPTKFADFQVTDDSGVPYILRVDRYEFSPLGERMLDLISPGNDHLLVRGRKLPGFPMVKVERVKCLNRELKL